MTRLLVRVRARAIPAAIFYAWRSTWWCPGCMVTRTDTGIFHRSWSAAHTAAMSAATVHATECEPLQRLNQGLAPFVGAPWHIEEVLS